MYIYAMKPYMGDINIPSAAKFFEISSAIFNDIIWSINSLRPGDADMSQYIRPSLFQIIAYGLFSTKPLSKPMLA